MELTDEISLVSKGLSDFNTGDVFRAAASPPALSLPKRLGYPHSI
jgi:hypothetical protein